MTELVDCPLGLTLARPGILVEGGRWVVCGG